MLLHCGIQWIRILFSVFITPEKERLAPSGLPAQPLRLIKGRHTAVNTATNPFCLHGGLHIIFSVTGKLPTNLSKFSSFLAHHSHFLRPINTFIHSMQIIVILFHIIPFIPHFFHFYTTSKPDISSKWTPPEDRVRLFIIPTFFPIHRYQTPYSSRQM